MSPRHWLGVQASRLGDWLMYPHPAECALPGCRYYETAGVHEPADECVGECAKDPSRRSEHHAFECSGWRRALNFGRR